MCNEQKVKHRINKLSVMLFTLILLSPFSAFADLTGKWIESGGGIYYVREVNNEVFWYGESSRTNPQWTNVARGTFDSDNILLMRWADVPKGSNKLSGTLTIKVSSDQRSMTAVQKTGGFGGTHWQKE